MTIENKLLTVPELSEYLGIAIETLKKYRMRGTGPKFIKLGRLVRYRLSDVDEWVAEITKEKEYEVWRFINWIFVFLSALLCA